MPERPLRSSRHESELHRWGANLNATVIAAIISIVGVGPVRLLDGRLTALPAAPGPAQPLPW